MIVEGLRMDSLRRLRVAHISQSLEIGGQERLMVEFARHRDRDRFDLPIFFSAIEVNWPRSSAEAKVHTLNTPTGLSCPFFGD